MVSLLGDFYLTVLSQLHDQFGGTYFQANFVKANRLYGPMLIGNNCWIATPDVNQALQSWENAFKTTMETCIPKGALPTHMNLPRLSKHLKRAMEKQKHLIPKDKVIRVS